ncbi:MAG: SNF2-related protein [Thermaerobacter sp.]|nr:SNF2-related protein [Thermaerobacter sp.]
MSPSDAERRSFADNRGGKTVAGAIRALASYFRHEHPLAIATGYFDLGGYAAIEDVLGAALAVRVLLGAEPLLPKSRRLRLPGDPDLARVLAEEEEVLHDDRDLLPFDAPSHALLQRFLAFLARPQVQVRRYTRTFLHGKAFVFGDEAGVLAGSANFTGKGLTENLELVLGQYQPEDVRKVRRWFDGLWEEAEPYDLAAAYRGRDIPFEPHRIYLRMLLELYEEELLGDEEREGPPGAPAVPLAEFQRRGTRRTLRILDHWGGAILADGVGLGKTYMAGGIIEHFVREQGQRALVVAPASLREQWRQFLLRAQLAVEVVSYQELVSDRQVGEPPGAGQPDQRTVRLELPAADYRLVVVDEAHALRNPDTLHYRALRRLMAAGGVRRKLVLLTATPVNNSLWDLYHQILLFARHDAAFLRLGIPHLREFFKQALSMDFEEAAPRHLFPLLDAISVRRTRHHIQRYYADSTLETPEGLKPIRFPNPRLVPVAYSFEAALPGFFAAVAAAIEEELTLARYRPDAYRQAGQGEAASQEVLVGLLRSQLLKRFESSAFAFRRTLETLIQSHDAFLALLDRGVVARPGADLEELSDDLDDEGALARLQEEGEVEAAGGYDLERLRRDVEGDRACLRRLLERAGSVRPEDDPKLQALRRLLEECGRETGDARKVVLFSYYADTVEYIARELERAPLAAYAGRVAVCAGSGNVRDLEAYVSAEEAVMGFAPRSCGRRPEPEDLYDLLLATDVLAEGQNLQQAARVVNFDLPWNPMRLAQRNGRVDRIGSEHPEVLLYCFLPASELDAILRLEQRLRRKIAEANASVGVESPVLPDTAAVEREFGTARRRIEAVAAGDSRVLDELEEEIDVFAGETFRDELRRALMADEARELKQMPWGAGSGLRKPGVPGVVFAARVGREPAWRFVPLDPAAACGKDLLMALDRVRCRSDEPRHLPEDVRERLFELWERARGSIHADYQERLDPARSAVTVPRAQREAVAILRRADVEGAEEAVQALLVPWPQAVVRQLRAAMREGGASPEDTARRIVEFVRQEGLRGPTAEEMPEPVPMEQVALVCYQAVVPE